MATLRFSPTKLSTYLLCPKQYYFAYLRKLPRRARSYFSLGTSVHSALQTFHEAGGTQTQDVGQLLGQLDAAWVDAGYTTPEQQAASLTLGQQMLASYYEAAEQKAAETLFLERTLSVPRDGYLLTGRVDRIDRRPDGLIEVVDYKSGGYLPTAEELANDLAIGIYQVLVARNMDAKPIVGTILNLRSGDSVSLIRDEPQLQIVEQHVSEVVASIRSDTKFQPVPGRYCDWCDFAQYCPAAPRPAKLPRA